MPSECSKGQNPEELTEVTDFGMVNGHEKSRRSNLIRIHEDCQGMGSSLSELQTKLSNLLTQIQALLAERKE